MKKIYKKEVIYNGIKYNVKIIDTKDVDGDEVWKIRIYSPKNLLPVYVRCTYKMTNNNLIEAVKETFIYYENQNKKKNKEQKLIQEFLEWNGVIENENK